MLKHPAHSDGSPLKWAWERASARFHLLSRRIHPSALSITILLVSITSFLSSAQTTLTFTSALPFDLSGFGGLTLEGSWQWQGAPWTVGASATLTPTSFESAKLSVSYQISQIQASANATLSLEGLKSIETQLKAELSGLVSLENTLNFGRRGLRSGKVTVKLGPSALNISGSAQLTPEGLVAPTGAVNFSLSQEHGDLSGTTNFSAHGFKEQTLSAVGYLSEAWTLTMTSRLTPKGLESESFDLAVALWDGLASLSFSVTVEGRGITSESVSLDLMLDGLFVQASVDFSGLELSGFQLMANGFLGDLSLDALVMGSLDGIQFATLTASGELFDFNVSASLDMSAFGLDNLSLSASRALGRWTFSAEGTFGADGFQGGTLKASYSIKI